MIVVVLLTGALIAFANGQNDVSKGIATLVGSGVTNHRRAIVWGALWTGAGGLAAAVLAGAMVATFGKGLLVAGTTATLAAALAMLLGAAVWVMIATRTGLPVSTTHAIVGSLTGVTVIAYGAGAIHWASLERKIVLPLLLTPLVALAATALLLRATRRPGTVAADCACVVPARAAIIADGALCAAARVAMVPPRLVLATSAACAAAPVTARVTINHLHWLTSGATSFARGLNDAPKIVALSLAGAILTGEAITGPTWFVVITAAMVAGSLYGGLRVTRVLAERVTRMDHHEGFVANLVTAVLVGLGAWQGLPLSTTHVSTGAIVGAGTQRAGAIDWRTVRGLLLAWVVTLPCAAALGILLYGLLRVIGV